MILQVIVLRDIKANAYGQPAFVPNIGSAIRDFGDQIKKPEAGALHAHPEDFELWHIGEYDDQDGTIIDFKQHHAVYGNDQYTNRRKQIAVGSDYKP